MEIVGSGVVVVVVVERGLTGDMRVRKTQHVNNLTSFSLLAGHTFFWVLALSLDVIVASGEDAHHSGDRTGQRDSHEDLSRQGSHYDSWQHDQWQDPQDEDGSSCEEPRAGQSRRLGRTLSFWDIIANYSNGAGGASLQVRQ